MGVRGGRIMGLPRVGPVGLELAFAVLEIQQEHDGSEKRVVYWDASRESATGGIPFFGLKNRFSLPPTFVG